MSKTSRLIVIVAIVAGIASPVLAQSRHIALPTNATIADPALTGGGSVGYNTDLPKNSD